MKQSLPHGSVLRALQVFHYLTPLLAAAIFGAASAVVFCTLQSSKKTPSNRTRHSTALSLTLTVSVSYVAECALYIVRALLQHGWWAPQDAILYVMISVLVWGCIFLVLQESKAPVWNPYVLSWICGFGLEIIVCTLSTVAFPREDNFDNVRLALQALRIFILFVLSGNGILLAYRGGKGEDQRDDERQPLLSNASVRASGSGGGSDGGEDSEDDNKKLKEQQRKRLEEQGGWLGYLKGFLIFLPYVWPSKDRRIQLYIVLIGLYLVAQRLLNVLIPRQLGIIIDKLSLTSGIGQL